MNLFKNEQENELQYIWRVCSLKDSGSVDMTWGELADIINKELCDDESEYLSSSAYRKKYQQAKAFYEEVFSKLLPHEEEKNITQQIHMLEKEKVKVRDERNELKRMIREQARKESLREQIERIIEEYPYEPLKDDVKREVGVPIANESSMIIPLTDLHSGLVVDNFFNMYNVKILRERLLKYIEKIKVISETHNAGTAYVVISECVSGLIHDTIRIESNQNVIEQFLTVSYLIADFLISLTDVFATINVYVCPGNHSRLFQRKEDNMKGENLDNLIIPFLTARLQNYEQIHCNDNHVEESIAMFSVRGHSVFAVHGDKDKIEDVVQKLTMMFRIKPEIIYMGHLHYNEMKTIYDTKVIRSGSFSGVDNYCLDNRLKNKPEQAIAVITDDGLDCIYDVTL